MPAPINIVYTTHTQPAYMPPLALSPRQVIVGPGYPSRAENGLVRSVNVAPGGFDLAAVAASLPPDQKPALTVVLADSFRNCIPRNLAGVPGRKVLLIADTHHGTAPLRTALAYARSEPFDRIAVVHDPHHLHWFAEAGLRDAVYIPNINCAHHPQPVNESRRRVIAFVGQAGQWHPRRRRLLDAMRAAGLPVIERQAPAGAAATLYAAAQITFNCSLNGDLNMRTFEVLGAGGCLVTDRLSPQAGLEHLFRRGGHYVDYADADDLIRIMRHYLAHPDQCLAVARAGQAAYLASHTPAQRVRDLFDLTNDPPAVARYAQDARAEPDGPGFGGNLDARVGLYEFVQQLALGNERVSVVADAAAGARAIADLVDLPRLAVTVRETAGTAPDFRDDLARLGVLPQVTFAGDEQRSCDVRLTDAATAASVSHESGPRPRWLAVLPASAGDIPAGQLAAQGFRRDAQMPWLFADAR